MYKAEDTKLHRTVAIKLLPPHLLDNDFVRQRLLCEAQAAAALNHPNVCAIHSIGEHEGMQFIEMEFVDGVTLGQRLAQGPLDMNEAIKYAIQIGEALLEAHGKGIIHRDIKSDNIMIDSRGRIKVMDFGLAKFRDASNLTRSGGAPGTLAYMSPEQIQTGNVDARSDLFSFGIVLFEMLTGHRPFRETYEAAVLYSILNEPPEPIQNSLPAASSELVHVIQTALEKHPDDRYSSADEMVRDLRRVLRQSSPTQQQTVSRTFELSASQSGPIGKHTKRWFIIAGALAGIILLVYMVITLLFDGPTLQHRMDLRRITSTGRMFIPSISPDGKSIAFVERDSLFRIVTRDINEGNALRISSSKKEIWDLRWSSTGTDLLVVEEGSAYTIPRLGGTHRYLERLPLSPRPKACWSPDGEEIAVTTADSRCIRILRRSTGDTRSVPVQGAYVFLYDIDWSPDGRWFLILTKDQRGYALTLVERDGHAMHTIMHSVPEIHCPRWSRRGDAAYYMVNNGDSKDLMKINVDSESGTISGDPVIVQTIPQAGPFFSVSSGDARFLYTTVVTKSSSLWWAQWNPNDHRITHELDLKTITADLIQTASLSPNGRHVVYSMGNSNASNIFVLPVSGGVQRQLTFLKSRNTNPVWSPDGRFVIFASTEHEKRNIWSMDTNGAALRCLDTATIGMDAELHWSPSGRIFSQLPGNRNFRILDPATQERKLLVHNDTVGWMFYLQVSPDGKMAAVWWKRGQYQAQNGLWVVSLVDTSQHLLVRGSARPLQWSADGAWVYFTNIYTMEDVLYEPRVYRIPVQGGMIEPVVSLSLRDDILEMSMNKRGNSIVCIVRDRLSDIWLIEDSDVEPGQETMSVTRRRYNSLAALSQANSRLSHNRRIP